MREWILAEFEGEDRLLAAARQLRAEGHRDLDLHSPVPIHGAPEALGLPRSRLPLVCAIGGLVGVVSGYVLQWWTVGVDFPINVGNRPPHSPLAFVPITFELGILFASLAVFFALVIRCGLPLPHHPVFEVERFRGASIDGLWLSVPVEAGAATPADELLSLGATRLERVTLPGNAT